MNGTPPRAGCILITNRYGDVVQHYNEQSIINDFMRYCQFMDLEEPGDAPHSAWRWNSETQSHWGGFVQVSDRHCE